MHKTLRIYPNGDYVMNLVDPDHLYTHIAYNKSYRPGTSLFVDGELLKSGIGVTQEQEKYVLRTWGGFTFPETCTVPYK